MRGQETFLRAALAGLKRHARPLGLVTLGVLTAYGAYHLALDTPDWGAVFGRWQAMGGWMGAVLLLAVADWTLEAICWMWLYGRLQIPVRDGVGVSVYLAGHAGLLIPAQIGRIIRPDAIGRLGRGSLSNSIKAEAVLLYVDTAAAIVTITALAFFWIEPLAVPVVALGVSAAMLFLADRVASLLSRTRLSLPSSFWLRPQTFAVLWLIIAGWVANGLALYVLVRGLAPGIGAPEVIFFASLSRLVGAGTGVPGGIGVTEGLLGASLGILAIPVDHLILAVVAYRVATFWVLLPVGWLALLFVNRRVVTARDRLGQRLQVALK